VRWSRQPHWTESPIARREPKLRSIARFLPFAKPQPQSLIAEAEGRLCSIRSIRSTLAPTDGEARSAGISSGRWRNTLLDLRCRQGKPLGRLVGQTTAGQAIRTEGPLQVSEINDAKYSLRRPALPSVTMTQPRLSIISSLPIFPFHNTEAKALQTLPG
jgi:hypothetical protein